MRIVFACITGLAGAVVVISIAACGHAPAPPPPVALVVALPVHPDGKAIGSEAVRYPVEVIARYSNTMSFRVPGKLIKRTVRLGDSVKQGQLIAQLDPVDAQKQLASSNAALDAAEHRLVYARQQLDRDKAQNEANLIAANQFEQSQDNFTAALAARDQAAAQLVVARNNLRYNTLVADHDGSITSENADTGQVVSAGQAVYGLAWNGATDVILDAAESDLGRIAVGQVASVTLSALPGRQFEAHVREIAPAADPQSRTYRVKLTMTEPPPGVRFGMTGDVRLAPLSTAGAPQPQSTSYTLPSTAIFHQDSKPAVWIVSGNDSTLQLRPVRVSRYNDHTSVISSGLNDGDVVVVAGVHTVYAGQHVKAVKPLFDGEGNVDRPAEASAATAGAK